MKKIYLKKKLFHILPVCGLMLTATSCSDDFFNLKNPNQVENTSFWKTEQDALMGLTACYDALQSDNLYDDYLDGGGYGFLMRETTSDNGEHSWGTWMLGSTVAMGTSGTNDGCFSSYWNANYELIKRCNLLISNIDESTMGKETAGRYKAEAIALRALGYCNLVSLYRDVPYLEKPLTLREAEAPVEKKEVIAKKVLDDLAANIPFLPKRGKEAKGRMCQEAAYAIMGRMALFTKHYDIAIDAYKKVIGAYSLFKAGDGTDYQKNFADLFTEANENCNEVILGVHYKGPGLGEGQTFSICWGTPMTAVQASMNLCDEYYCTDGLPIDKSPLFKGSLEKGGHSRANIDYPRFENRDPRMKATLAVPGTEWQTGMIVGSEKTKNNFNKSTVYIRKWFIPNKTTNEYDGSFDYYVIRYAEVLLSLAEAMIEKGGYSQAEITPYINEVRSRVGMPAVEKVEGSGLNQEALRSIVRHERRVELAFEDLRLADLYRWNDWENSVKRMLRDKEWYDGTCYAHDYRGPQDTVWPIPQSEIDTNKKLEQHAEWK